jgi:hypothetical protein
MNPMQSVIRLLWLLLAATAFPATSIAAEKDFPGIEHLMTADEFARAGLDKLTPAQMAALHDWLVHYTAGPADVVQKTSVEVKKASEDFRIVAHVLPPFTGWTGQTIFRLDNGQAWRQRISGRYSYNGQDTEVVITRNFAGFYVMTLTASGRSIGIEPAQ